MKTRLLSTLALLSLMVLAFASPAAAQKPIPPISSTQPFKALKNYVNLLGGRATVPATVQKKQQFRAALATKRIAANNKAKSLYAKRVVRISKQDDKKENRQIKLIRQTQKTKVSGVKADLASRLAALTVKQNNAIAKVNASYDGRITSNSNKREILQGRLDKAKTPAQREKLTKKITSVQKVINNLANAKQADLSVVESSYATRSANIQNTFNAKIQRVKDAAARQIKQAKLAYKRLYREALAAAKEKQTAEIELITTVRERGAGYIDQMPVV